NARLQRAGDEAQALAARVGHVRARAEGRARARGEPLPGDLVAARSALVPERGALRDRLGRGGRGPGVLRVGARVREGADRLWQADRRLPADATEARGD